MYLAQMLVDGVWQPLFRTLSMPELRQRLFFWQCSRPTSTIRVSNAGNFIFEGKIGDYLDRLAEE